MASDPGGEPTPQRRVRALRRLRRESRVFTPVREEMSESEKRREGEGEADESTREAYAHGVEREEGGAGGPDGATGAAGDADGKGEEDGESSSGMAARVEGLEAKVAALTSMMAESQGNVKAMLELLTKSKKSESESEDEDDLGSMAVFARVKDSTVKEYHKEKRRESAAADGHDKVFGTSTTVREYNKKAFLNFEGSVKKKMEFDGHKPQSRGTVNRIRAMRELWSTGLDELIRMEKTNAGVMDVIYAAVLLLERLWGKGPKDHVRKVRENWRGTDFVAMHEEIWRVIEHEYGVEDTVALSMAELVQVRPTNMDLRSFVDKYQEKVTNLERASETQGCPMPSQEVLANLFRAACNSRVLSKGIFEATKVHKESWGGDLVKWSELATALRSNTFFQKYNRGNSEDIVKIDQEQDQWIAVSKRKPAVLAGVAGSQADGLKGALGKKFQKKGDKGGKAPPGTWEGGARAGAAGGAGRPAAGECFECGSTDHFAYRCPHVSSAVRKASTLQRIRKGQSVNDRALLKLQLSEDELSEEAIRVAVEGAKSRQRAAWTDAKVQPVMVERQARVATAEVRKMRGMAAFERSAETKEVPVEDQMHVAASVNGAPMCVVVDSGAMTNLIPAGTCAQVMREGGLKEWSAADIAALSGIGSDSVRVGGVVTLPVSIQGVVNELDFAVVAEIGGNPKAPALMGMPALREAGLVIDFEKGTATIRGSRAVVKLYASVRECFEAEPVVAAAARKA